METSSEVARATGDLRPAVGMATARTWDTTTRLAQAIPSPRLAGDSDSPTASTPAPVLVRAQEEDGLRLRTGTVADWRVLGSLAAPATPGLAVRPEMLVEMAIKLGPGLAEDFPTRRETGGAEVEREEVTGEDLVVDLLLLVVGGVREYRGRRGRRRTSGLEEVAQTEMTDVDEVDEVDEVVTEDLEGEAEAEVEKREAGEGREASQPGAMARVEDPGEEGDEVVAGFPGRPSSLTAW